MAERKKTTEAADFTNLRQNSGTDNQKQTVMMFGLNLFTQLVRATRNVYRY